MTDAAFAPTPLQREALLNDIGPLPLSGQAWPDWVRILTWIVLAVVGVQAISAAIRMPREEANLVMAGFVALCFLALGFVSLYMQTSVTTIDEAGLHQSWIRPRDVAWHDIHFARFVPLFFSKRLVVFPQSGRPVVFQGGTRELQEAFAKISVLYQGTRHADPR